MGRKELSCGKRQDPAPNTRLELQAPTAQRLLARAVLLVLWDPKSVRMSGRILYLRKQDGG